MRLFFLPELHNNPQVNLLVFVIWLLDILNRPGFEIILLNVGLDCFLYTKSKVSLLGLRHRWLSWLLMAVLREKNISVFLNKLGHLFLMAKLRVFFWQFFFWANYGVMGGPKGTILRALALSAI